MSKRILRLLMSLAAVGALVAGGATLSTATTPRPAPGESSTESTAPENSAADPDNVQYTAPGDADYSGTPAVRQSSTRTAAARRQAQRGRHRTRHSTVRNPARSAQSTPAPDEQSTESESSVESEQGQPGEPVTGHEDPPGQNTNNECTGDCVQ
jgi:hypothetical protein